MNSETLGRLLLLQSTIHVMRGNEAMARFACRGLSGIPGFESTAMFIAGRYYTEGDGLCIPEEECRGLHHRLADPNFRRTDRERCLKEFETRHGVRCLLIETSFSLYGFLVVPQPDAGRPEDILPYVRNSLNLIALIIENNRQQEELLRSKQELEAAVAARTRELETANRELTAEIAERRRAEQERKALQDQLIQSQKLESIGRLAGGVAHDFNNMLAVILGNTEMLLEALEPSDPRRSELEEIKKAATRSADLTSQLLAFARKQLVKPRILDLNRTIAGMLKMLGRLIGENIALEWRPGADLWPVRIDPAQVDQLIANLCLNARDAISGEGRIAIATGNIRPETAGGDRPIAPSGDHVVITVTDNGCGMETAVLAHLFEPFFTTKDVGKGTGLGLATVYGIVKQNNGFITVDSSPGAGATFRIYLPRYPFPADDGQTAPRTKVLPGRNEVILLVEDEPAILSTGKAMLEKLGYCVLCASTPGQALQLAQRHNGTIHLLMTDVIMPEMNGRDLAKKMLAFQPHLKHLFMSGYSADIITHHGALDDGIQFIQKPFTKQELSVKIRAVLDQ
ncbi:MAG: ATP-binding protein [Thermodesulfobacteriota bacterium]